MNLKKTLFLLLLTGIVLVTVSCGDYVGKEKSHPFFVKAESSKNAGNYKEATQYFEEFLNVCPRSPAVHYELGSLYTDHLDDPYKAIYHYRRFLELNRNSPDAENIRTFIESAKRKIFEQLSKRFESADTARAYAEAEKIRKILDQYVAYSRKLRNQNDTLRSQNEEMRKRIESFARESEKFRKTVKDLERRASQGQLAGPEKPKSETARPSETVPAPVVTAQNPETKPKKTETPQSAPEPKKTESAPTTPSPDPNRTPGVPADSADEWENAEIAAQSPNAAAGKKDPGAEKKGETPAVRRHQVQKGDTLYGIALKYYKKASAVRLIREANTEVLKGRDLLRIGQVLVIPPAPESKGEKR